MIRQRLHPDAHPSRLIGPAEAAAGSVHRLQKAAETAGPDELRELLAQTLAALQTATDCVAVLLRREARR